MTKLEFINEKIKNRKESIKYWKELLKKYPGEEVFTRCLNKCKEELQTLQQIKTDLEAWEVVKKYLFVDKNTFEEDWEEFEYEYIRFINENICPMHESNFEEIDIIKKALEVEDEKNN